MSSDADGFLARIRELPDDDGPRLIFADWLDEEGDPRGEFIRVQVALAKLPPFDRRRPGLVRTEQELLLRHADDWALPFRGLASGPVFRRGFVDEVKITARGFLAHGEALFQAGPIRHLHLIDVGSHLEPAFASPLLAKLTGLTLFAQHMGEPLARAVAECPYLNGLRVLQLGRNRIGDRGADRLAGSVLLSDVEDFDLSENELGEAGVLAIGGGRFGKLRRLELGGNAIGPLAATALAASPNLPLLDRLGLSANRIGSARLATLAAAPALLRVGALDLAANGLMAPGLRAILAGPLAAAVRELDLSQNDIGDDGATVLAHAPTVAGLRTLRLTATGLTDLGLAALADSPHLARLSALDLGNNPIGDDGFRSVLESRTLRHLRRLIYSEIAVSFRMRLALEMRFNRDPG